MALFEWNYPLTNDIWLTAAGEVLKLFIQTNINLSDYINA